MALSRDTMTYDLVFRASTDIDAAHLRASSRSQSGLGGVIGAAMARKLAGGHGLVVRTVGRCLLIQAKGSALSPSGGARPGRRAGRAWPRSR
jgi:hypothetical protein